MIKEKLIDAIYESKADRDKAYRLVNEIIKKKVLLDSQDEWKSPGDLHNIPTLVA
ncbi:hypothetical protein DPMN_061550 [Dreissena polymorpha]|uniref:Uncharacterized protein n=1 Tax=Dreissena polymorpha TaxID=45954 RepID=A0A9D4HII0_DREPO|nr:hypothetical protein DPMN_061550 [Dreissena polymorpha]